MAGVTPGSARFPYSDSESSSEGDSDASPTYAHGGATSEGEAHASDRNCMGGRPVCCPSALSWAQHAALAALLVAGVVAFITARAPSKRRGFGGAMGFAEAQRNGPRRNWRVLGDGHRVAREEGAELGVVTEVYHVSKCIKACNAESQCFSFSMCQHACYLKTKQVDADEPSVYMEFCSTYFVVPDTNDSQVPEQVWVLFGGGDLVPINEGLSVATQWGELGDCENSCSRNPACASFSRCGKQCWLKNVPLTGSEQAKWSRCNYYYRAFGGVPPAPPCPAGQLWQPNGSCRRPAVGSLMTFYMYRAQSAGNVPVDEGLNLGNAPGVMWYLHNEVIGHCPRKFHIFRVIRFKVTMRASHALAKRGRNFDQFLQFDGARCSNPRCSTVFRRYGYVVGCIGNSQAVASYPRTAWYSLPGKCPHKHWRDKDDACNAREPGGFCKSPDGSKTCTFHIEYAGDITMEDLTGIMNYTDWCKRHNERSYHFWVGRHDPVHCQARVDKLKALFYNKYPSQPVDFGEPRCDWR